MAHYFLVAFGHGVGASLTIPPEEAAENLRRLLDDSCAATFGAFPDDVIASVAPSGVMLAFPDATPDRAVQLCESVKSQLEQDARKGVQILPIYAVITFGPMRSVNEPGFSSNFEGRPAIAAARILAKLPSGRLAVEESAWEFETLARHLGEPQRLEGKHAGEAFSIRVHQQIIFPGPLGGMPLESSLPTSPKAAPLQTSLQFFRPIRVEDDWIKYADGEREELDDSDLPFYPRRANPGSEAILAREGGWFECVAGPGQGKTAFAYHLMRCALSQSRAALYRDARDARLSSEGIVWPLGLEKSQALVVLDNAHLLEDRELRPLANSLPVGVTAVAFSRASKIKMIRPLTCQSVELDPHDRKRYMSENEVAEVVRREGWYPLFERITSEVIDWVEAKWLLDDLADDSQNVRRELHRAGSLAGYLRHRMFRRLTDEGLIGDKDNEEGRVGKEVLLELASFSLLDLEMNPGELNATGSREAYFQKLVQKGWVPKDRAQLKHPRIAERVLRALDKLDANNHGAPVGRILADVLIRSQAERERLAEIRRHARYGILPDSQDLLSAFYNRLEEQRDKHQIPLDLVYMDRAGLRRENDSPEDAVKELDRVAPEFRGPIWYYERAYVCFMGGTVENLADGKRYLNQGLQYASSQDDRFINRGLYAKILARQGRLQEAYDLLGSLRAQASEYFGEDARRWVVHVAGHRCEFGSGLVAHGGLLPDELDQRFTELEEAYAGGDYSDKSWFYLNDALRCAVKGDPEGTRENAQKAFENPRRRHTGEQKATHLALLGVAAEVLQDFEAARKAYKKILQLSPDLDNRLGQRWAKERIGRVGEKVTPELLTAVVKVLYPIRPDILPATD